MVDYTPNVGAAMEKYRAEEEAKKKRGETPMKALIGAATAYFTGGLSSLLGGATAAASFVPTAANVVPAISAGLKASEAPSLEGAAISGASKAAQTAVGRLAEKGLTESGMIKSGAKVDDTGKISSTFENQKVAGQEDWWTLKDAQSKGTLHTSPKKGAYQINLKGYGLRYLMPHKKAEKPETPKDPFEVAGKKSKAIQDIEDSLRDNPDVANMEEGTVFKDEITGFTFKKVGGVVKLQYGQ